MYNLCINKRMWKNPEQGFIKGRVIQTKPGMLQIKDASNNLWQINSKQNLDLDDHHQVRIIGEKMEHGIFKAKRIFPCKDVIK